MSPPADWAAFKEAALSAAGEALVHHFYADVLTGASAGTGFLKARDPWAGDGDKNASCTVSDGSTKVPLGTFTSHREDHFDGDNPASGSIFDYLMKARNIDFIAAARLVSDFTGVPLPGDGKGKKPKGKYKKPEPREVVYDYCNLDNRVVRRVKRVRTSDGSKTFYQFRIIDGEEFDGIAGAPDLPYRLPEVAAAAAEEKWVFVVEGEKDVDNIKEAWGSAATCNPAGAGKWFAAHTRALAKAGVQRVIILPDNDVPGVGHAFSVALSLYLVGIRARIIKLPGLAEKGDVSDWIAAGRQRGELVDLIGKARDWEPKTVGVLKPELVTNGRELAEVVGDALRHLSRANHAEPLLFRRSAGLARVRRDEQNRPVLDELGVDVARTELAGVVACCRVIADGKRVLGSPPDDLCKSLLALAAWPGLPPLEGVIETPTLRDDGTLLTKAGYDRPTKLYHVLDNKLGELKIAEEPTQPDARDAVAVLDDAIHDFPFAAESDRAGALALLLTTVIRIEGRGMGALIDAPQAGTGKSLLSSLVAVIATGAPARVTTAPGDEEEWRKTITAQIATGTPLFILDNVSRKLSSSSLSAALTGTTWEARKLGTGKIGRWPNRTTVIINGNNVRLAHDLARRVHPIRLDAQTSQPFRRDPASFRHRDLLSWARADRGKLITALLTIARAWHVADRPLAPGLRPLGSFEEWCETIGGMLAFAGVENFLGGMEQQLDQTDDESREWHGFLEALIALEGISSFGLKAGVIADKIGVDNELREALPSALSKVAEHKAKLATALGKAFGKFEGRRFGARDIHLVRGDSHRRAIMWKVVQKEAVASEESRGTSHDTEAASTTRQGAMDVF